MKSKIKVSPKCKIHHELSNRAAKEIKTKEKKIEFEKAENASVILSTEY